MGEFFCFYHVNTKATHKCHICGKYICLDCLQTPNPKENPINAVACPECLYDL